MHWYILLVMALAVNANPIAVQIIDEFQVAPYDSERVELRFLQTPAWDTVFVDTFPLLNVPVSTPAGQSFIAANLYLAGMEPVVIDRSVLSGSFGLPDDSGFIYFGYDLFGGDTIRYPGHATTWQHAPAPPPYFSCAKFHMYVFVDFYEYMLITDWYTDPTPTFGAPNDDYPGCYVGGCVFDNSNQPLAGARVTARFNYLDYMTFPVTPYWTCCTTYAAVDGTFSFDSLLPYYYDIEVHAEGYLPDTQTVGLLCCTQPITDLDFYLSTGIDESHGATVRPGAFVYPNPFRRELQINVSMPLERIEIYDVAGTLVRRIENPAPNTSLIVDGAGLSPGIYFVALGGRTVKVIKF